MDTSWIVDEKKLKEIINTYYSPLVYFCYSVLEKQEDTMNLAKDIVGDTFAKLWERKDNFDDDHKIKAWLYLTVKHAALNLIRHLQVREKSKNHLAYLSDFDRETDILNKMIRTEFLTKIMNAIDELPEKRREVFLL